MKLQMICVRDVGVCDEARLCEMFLELIDINYERVQDPARAMQLTQGKAHPSWAFAFVNKEGTFVADNIFDLVKYIEHAGLRPC